MKSPRRDQLKSLLADLAPPVREVPPQAGNSPEPMAPETKSEPRVRTLMPDRAISGSVRAMSRSLGELGAAAEEAARLREQLATGLAIVAVDPALVDPSFVADRLDGHDTPEGLAFLDDIRAHGQQVPVLLRPHPDVPGRYQIAYGHRRLWAARRLGVPVNAQVRPLTDAELVIAQGQENAQRRDLSFIEKAMFARALDERGFDRATLMAALAVQTAEVSRLLSVAKAMPAELIAAIGPAPKAGRPRWLALAEKVQGKPALGRALAALNALDAARLDSDGRFARAFAAATGQGPAAAKPRVVLKEGVRPLVSLKTQGPGATLNFGDKPFAEYVAAHIEALYSGWKKGMGG